MANTCEWQMTVVSKTKKSLRRLVDILLYKDPEFCLCHCRQTDFQDREKEFAPEKDEQSGLWSMCLEGEVAWSCAGWFKRMKRACFYGKKAEGGLGTFRVFQAICKALNIGVELYAADGEQCVQEHYAVNHLGRLIHSETEGFVPSEGSDNEWRSMDDLIGMRVGEDCDGEDWDDEDDSWLPENWGWRHYGIYKPVEAIFGIDRVKSGQAAKNEGRRR